MGITAMIARMYIYLVVLINLGRLLDFFPELTPFHIGKLTLGSALLYVLAAQGGSLPRLVKENPFTPYLAVILAVAVLGVPFSVWRSGALEHVIHYLKTLASFVIICSLVSQTGAATLRNAMVLTVGMLALLMVMTTGSGRLNVSDTYDPNDIALFFVTFLPLVVSMAVTDKGVFRMCACGTALLALMGIALTQSRGGIVALAAVGLHTLFLTRRRWLILPALCLGAAVVLSTADDALWMRFRDLHNETDYNFDDRVGRIAIWKEGLLLFIRHPLLGVGIGQFSSALGMVGSGLYKAAHNSYIQIAAELGIAGITAYCAMLWRVRRIALAGLASPLSGQHDRTRYTGLMLSFTGFAVGSVFLSQAYGSILYALLVLSAALAHENARHQTGRSARAITARPATVPGDAAYAEAKLAHRPAPQTSPQAAPQIIPQIGPARVALSSPIPGTGPAARPSLLARADAVREARERLLAQGRRAQPQPQGREKP